jgi:hypothetical protein
LRNGAAIDVSFSGGTTARPTPEQIVPGNERRIPRIAEQTRHAEASTR